MRYSLTTACVLWGLQGVAMAQVTVPFPDPPEQSIRPIASPENDQPSDPRETADRGTLSGDPERAVVEFVNPDQGSVPVRSTGEIITNNNQKRRLVTDAAHIEILSELDEDRYLIVTYDEKGDPTRDGNVFIDDAKNGVACTSSTSLDELEAIGVTPRFALVLDHSGSMAPSIDQVKALAVRFIESLPDEALCKVVWFNDAVTSMNTGNQQGFYPCNPEFFNMTTIKGSGGTVMQPALIHALDTMHHPEVNTNPEALDIKGIFLVTDGEVEALDVATILTHRKQTPIFAHFVGKKTDVDPARQWTTLVGTGVMADLMSAFTAHSDRFTHGRVVDVASCKAMKFSQAREQRFADLSPATRRLR